MSRHLRRIERMDTGRKNRAVPESAWPGGLTSLELHANVVRFTTALAALGQGIKRASDMEHDLASEREDQTMNDMTKVTSEEIHELIDRLIGIEPDIFERAWDEMENMVFHNSGLTILDAINSLARVLKDDEDKEADPVAHQLKENAKKLDRLSAEVEELKRSTKKGFWK